MSLSEPKINVSIKSSAAGSKSWRKTLAYYTAC